MTGSETPDQNERNNEHIVPTTIRHNAALKTLKHSANGIWPYRRRDYQHEKDASSTIKNRRVKCGCFFFHQFCFPKCVVSI